MFLEPQGNVSLRRHRGGPAVNIQHYRPRYKPHHGNVADCVPTGLRRVSSWFMGRTEEGGEGTSWTEERP